MSPYFLALFAGRPQHVTEQVRPWAFQLCRLEVDVSNLHLFERRFPPIGRLQEPRSLHEISTWIQNAIAGSGAIWLFSSPPRKRNLGVVVP